MTTAPENHPVRTLRLPWTLYTTLAVLICNYALLPRLFESALVMTWPLLASAPRFMATELFIVAAWLITFWLLGRARREEDSPLIDILGLRLNRRWYYYVVETLLAVLAAMTLIYALTALKDVTGMENHPDSQMTSAEMAGMGIIAVVFSPVMEELVFRGFLQSALSQRATVPGTIILTSTVFLLFHSMYFNSLIAVLYVFLLGLLLSYFRYRTGCVVPGMVAHLLNNWLTIRDMSGH